MPTVLGNQSLGALEEGNDEAANNRSRVANCQLEFALTLANIHLLITAYDYSMLETDRTLVHVGSSKDQGLQNQLSRAEHRCNEDAFSSSHAIERLQEMPSKMLHKVKQKERDREQGTRGNSPYNNQENGSKCGL